MTKAVFARRFEDATGFEFDDMWRVVGLLASGSSHFGDLHLYHKGGPPDLYLPHLTKSLWSSTHLRAAIAAVKEREGI